MLDPHGYTLNNDLQYESTKSFLDDVSSKLVWKEGEEVLDIGCGPGNVTVNLINSRMAPNSFLTGIDVSQDMVDYAKRIYKRPNVVFKQVNIEDPQIYQKWKPAQFDKIFSFYCLNWVKDKKLALKNIFHLLKPKGLLILMAPIQNGMGIVNACLASSPKWNKYLWVLDNFDIDFPIEGNPKDYCLQLMVESNFTNIDSEIVSSCHTFRDMSHALGFVKPLCPMIKYIPQELLNEFENDLEDIIKRNKLFVMMNSGSSEVYIDYGCWRVVANKPD